MTDTLTQKGMVLNLFFLIFLLGNGLASPGGATHTPTPIPLSGLEKQMKLIDISTQKHPNTFVMVDDEDYESLNQWKWSAHKDPGGYTYALREQTIDGKIFRTNLHRFLTKCPRGLLVDHKDGNTLNNQKNNLRICTNAQNQHNRIKGPRSKTSIYKGVRFQENKFSARIRVDGKRIHLGCFISEIDAALAYNAASLKYHGEFARLNEIPNQNGATYDRA